MANGIFSAPLIPDWQQPELPPVAGQLAVPGHADLGLGRDLANPNMGTVALPQGQSAIGTEMAGWDPEKQRRFAALSQDGQREALLTTQAAQQIEQPMNKGGLFNDFTVKDYAALLSAAGTLGSMLVPKPKPQQRGGGSIQGPGGGNPFLRRYV